MTDNKPPTITTDPADAKATVDSGPRSKSVSHLELSTNAIEPSAKGIEPSTSSNGSRKPAKHSQELNSLLRSELSNCLLRDHFKLSKQLHKLKKAQSSLSPEDFDKQLLSLKEKVQRSCHVVNHRRSLQREPEFPQELPVVAKLDTIKTAIAENQVVIVAGETGSGKTTQIPKICLSLGRGMRGMIGHTQPRRLAARSVANRIAQELHSEIGGLVGFKVRFSDQTGEDSLIKIMTDGILLAEIQQDRFLQNYDTIIIDEAHERTLNIDFLLGYLRQILPKRPDLKVIITSATLDHQRFSKFFNQAPVIEISGRTFPVELVYQPLVKDEGGGEGEAADNKQANQNNDRQALDINEAIFRAVNQVRRIGREKANAQANDILAFFSGEREIREAATYLRKKTIKGLEILPLYARLSNQEQNRIFQSHTGQRIILTTNVAETSLTVPNIGYVIDTGLVRTSRYSYRTKTQRLPIEAISQASANQRKGRCGRVADGVCIRLYSEEDFNARSEFTDPEILRTNLAAVILQLQLLKLGDVNQFPFIDAPDSRLVNDGYRLLQELQAIDQSKGITGFGRKLARFPVDPKLSRILLESDRNGALREALIIVSGLSVQDPRERPHEKAAQADEAHQQWRNNKSDFVGWVNLWESLEEQRQELTASQFKRYLKKHFLSYLRYREWRDVHRQLRLQCNEMGMKENQEPAQFGLLHQSLLQGLLSNVGVQDEPRSFLGARNRKFSVFPGSALAKKPPRWLMAAEVVETNKVYARTAAEIDPVWLETAAQHLLKKTHSEPHWSRKRSDVLAFEQASLYGLVVYDKRRVSFGPIDRVVAREVFIRAALVEQNFASQAAFYQHNCQLVLDVEVLENKMRRKDLLVDDQTLYDFYDAKLPPDVFNGKTFDAWLRRIEKKQPQILFLTEQDLLLRPEVKAEQEQRYPDSMRIAGIELELEYQFNPGAEEDGVILLIPVGVLHQVERGMTSWLVPGLLRDKCIAMLKALPKSIRKNFVPIPQYVDAVLERNLDKTQPIEQELSKHLAFITGVTIPNDSWEGLAWDKHFFMHYKVIDENKNTLALGNDLQQIKQDLSGRAAQLIQTKASTLSLEKDGITEWDFGDLPGVVDLGNSGQGSNHASNKAGQSKSQAVRAFPGLVDKQKSVAIQLFESAQQARSAHRHGLARLFALTLSQNARYIKKTFKQQKHLPFLYAGTGDVDKFVDDFLLSVILDVFVGMSESNVGALRSENDFKQRLASEKSKLNQTALDKQILLADIFEKYQSINKAVRAQNKPAWSLVIEDLKTQLEDLFHPDFLWNTPLLCLQRYPAYLAAIELRLERLPSNEQKVKQEMASIHSLVEACDGRRQQFQGNEEKLQELQGIRWLIEELRISYFAQSIKTKTTVSEKRLRKKLEAI